MSVRSLSERGGSNLRPQLQLTPSAARRVTANPRKLTKPEPLLTPQPSFIETNDGSGRGMRGQRNNRTRPMSPLDARDDDSEGTERAKLGDDVPWRQGGARQHLTILVGGDDVVIACQHDRGERVAVAVGFGLQLDRLVVAANRDLRDLWRD